MMRKFTLQIGLLLMAVLTISACHKDEEKDVIIPLAEVTNPGNNNNGYNGINGNAADGTSNYATLILDMQGAYDGEWSIDGQKVDAEESDVILSLFTYYYNNHREDIYNNLRIDFTSFPFRTIALRYGFQTMNVNSQSFEPKITSPRTLLSSATMSNETKLLYDICCPKDKADNYISWSSTTLKVVGYSDHLLYFELKSNFPFLGYPYVVTLEDGSYYGIILDVVPSLSTLTFDSTTKTVNFVCTISQIELYDQDRNKTIRELNPEMILTFTSTQKTKAGESGD